MRDLLAIVPSRGRSAEVAELYRAVRATASARTDVLVAFDDDDPQIGAYRRLRDATRADRRLLWACGPRKSLAEWTNRLALAYAGKYRALASLGDDHRPRTPGWDSALLAALDAAGGTGIAYGNDLLQGERLPTAVVMSSDIVAGLGWMCHPSLRHYCVDNVWKVIGETAGCLHYLPDVIIEHLHYLRTGDAPDATYRQAEARCDADREAYEEWLLRAANDDIEAVRGLLERVPA